MQVPAPLPHRRKLIWWISLAVLWAAWLPSWAPVLRSALSDVPVNWMEVCSVTGSRWVVADTSAGSASNDDNNGSMNGGMSCPFCLLQHHAWAPPPTVALHLLPLPRPQAALAVFHASVPRWALWPSAHPRAPPAQA